MDKGKLIVIEGCCDGCGKSTQLELLKEEYKDCITHHFPTYGSKYSYLVEEYLNRGLDNYQDIPDVVVNCYYAIDRENIWRTLLKKEYESGKMIILDRYTTSSLIYQTMNAKDMEHKKDLISQIQAFEYGVLKIKDPDLVIFLDGDFNVINNFRIRRNEGNNDYFEESSEKQRQVYESARIVCEYLKWYKVCVTDDNVMRSKEDIHNDIMRLIRTRLK